MDTKKLVQFGTVLAHFVASAAVSNTVTNVIMKNMPENMNTKNRVLVGIGTFIISSVVTDVCIDYVEREIVEAIQMIRNATESTEKPKEAV